MGGGNKKGGSTTANAPEVTVPPGLLQTISSTSGLGQYGTALLNPLSSMTNWAANIASGGFSQPIPSTNVAMPQTGPSVRFNGPIPWTTSFDPSTGLITYTETKGGQQFQNTPGEALAQNSPIDKGILNQWMSESNQAGSASQQGSNVWQQVSQSLGLSPADVSAFQQEGLTPNQVLAKFGHAPVAGGNAAPPGSSSATANLLSTLGPFLGKAWSTIGQEEQVAGEMPALQAQTAALTGEAEQRATQLYNQGQSILGTGNTMLKEATTGTGLFPSQAAYVEEAKRTGEIGEEAMLANAGLTQSTQAPALKEQADLSAAATAGQLIQGNISAAEQEQQIAQQQLNLSQASQKLAFEGQTLSLAEQTALSGEFASIATQSAAIQEQMWKEALGGYGMLGQIIGTAAGSYGYSLSGYQAILQSEEANAANQVGLEEAQLKSDSQSTSDMFGALGSLFGGGGSGGGLLGGLGGLLGIGGGAAAGGAAAGGGAVAGDALAAVSMLGTLAI